MAMSAAASANKTLRVAMMWGGTVHGEDTFKSPRALVVGDHGDAAFPLPDGVAEAKAITILKPEGNAYRLVASPEIDGDVWIGGERMTVREAIESGRDIGPSDYGMITIGPVAVFFQRAGAVPKMPKARAFFDGSVFGSIGLAAFLHVSLLFLFALASRELPERDELDLPPDLVRRFMVTPPPTVEEPPEVQHVERPREPTKREPTKRPQREQQEQRPQLTKTASQHLAHLEEARATSTTTERLMNALRTQTERPALGQLATAAGSRTGPATSSISRIGSALGSLGGTAPTITTSGGGDIATSGGAAATKGAGRLEARAGGGNVRGSVRAVQALARVEGTLDRGEVFAAINRAMPRIQRCYEQALTRNAGLSGRITFTWTVQPSGRAGDVRQSGSTFSDAQASNCMATVLRGIQFPRPAGGAVSITYPFIFQSAH